MIVTQNTKLNAVPGGIIPVVHVSQFDVNRALSFTIYDGNAPAVLDSGTVVTIEGTKPDGHGFAYTGTLVDNVATFNTTDQMTVLSGSIECKLALSLNSQVIGTAMFILDIEKAAIDGNTDMSDTEIPAIIELASQQESNAEAWANGTRGGVPTDPTDPTYHKDSRYWAEYAESAVTGVTGVKGNAEESYRRGNVNLTHADLGMDAAPTQGSINPVESNGIYEALQPITSSIVSIGGSIQTISGSIQTINGQIGNTDISSAGATLTGAYKGNLIANYNSTDIPFKFGIDSNGNYGYIKAGADTVIPFSAITNVPLGTYRYNEYYSGNVTRTGNVSKTTYQHVYIAGFFNIQGKGITTLTIKGVASNSYWVACGINNNGEITFIDIGGYSTSSKTGNVSNYRFIIVQSVIAQVDVTFG